MVLITLPDAAISPRHADRRRTALLLRDLVNAQKRFPAFFRDLSEAKALFGLDGRLVDANRSARLLLGDATQPLVGAQGQDGLPYCEQSEIREGFRTAASGKSAAFGLTLSAHGGRSIEGFLTPAIVDDVIVGVFATGREVTYRLEASRAAEIKMLELTALFERHTDAMIAIDAGGRIRGSNAAHERLTGYSGAALAGQPYTTLVPAEMIAHTTHLFGRAIAGETVTGTTVLRVRDERRVEVVGMAIPIVIAGVVVGVYAVGRDLAASLDDGDARVQAERVRELYLVAASSERTAESQIRAALVLGNERLGCEAAYLTRIDNDTVTFLYGVGEIAYASDASWPLDQSLHRHVVAAGRTFSMDNVAENERTAVKTTLPHAARSFIGAPLIVAGRVFGTLCFVSRTARASPFTDADRDFVRLIATLASSAIDRGDQSQRLNTLAFFDALTGLPNRVLLSDRLMQAIANSQRDGSVFAVHFYDLDGFKDINDFHGHLRGDDVLRLVAQRFERVARDVDTVARVGGDEFVVVQPGIYTMDDAIVLSRRLRDAISEPFIVNGRERYLSISGGIAMYPRDGTDAATLIARADAALYRVKGSGRDDVAFVTESDAAGDAATRS